MKSPETIMMRVQALESERDNAAEAGLAGQAEKISATINALRWAMAPQEDPPKTAVSEEDDWRKTWCPHCRCKAGKENRKIKYDVIKRDINTGEESRIYRACESCVEHISYNEPDYSEE